jgi:hypothetical protein
MRSGDGSRLGLFEIGMNKHSHLSPVVEAITSNKTGNGMNKHSYLSPLLKPSQETL